MSSTQEQAFDFTTLLNKGIKAFGHNNVLMHLQSFYNHYNDYHYNDSHYNDSHYNDSHNIPIISMGSGTGVIEHMATTSYYSKYNKLMNWICIDIDNNPLDFPSQARTHMNAPLMKIDYNSVDQLIDDKKEIVGKCILFLNWCLPNDSTYDFDAIIKLKPLAVFSIYEVYNDSFGAAGGEKFFDWTVNNQDYTLKETYTLCSQYHDDNHHDDYDDDELLDIRITWWQNNNIPNDEDIIYGQYPCLIANRKVNCCLQ
jgi:hypothetical protein